MQPIPAKHLSAAPHSAQAVCRASCAAARPTYPSALGLRCSAASRCTVPRAHCLVCTRRTAPRFHRPLPPPGCSAARRRSWAPRSGNRPAAVYPLPLRPLQGSILYLPPFEPPAFHRRNAAFLHPPNSGVPQKTYKLFSSSTIPSIKLRHIASSLLL